MPADGRSEAMACVHLLQQPRLPLPHEMDRRVGLVGGSVPEFGLMI
jgi:hypothetical protein